EQTAGSLTVTRQKTDSQRVKDWEAAKPPSKADRSTASAPKRTHKLTFVAALLVGIPLAAFGHAPILRGLASFLIAEDSLQPAAAIVPLGGQTPFREIEAARLYHAGWAPQVVIVRKAANAESKALQKLAIKDI